jgi:hypothetical protein
MCRPDEMWTPAELEQEKQIQDQLDLEAAQMHQQAMDEQQDLLNEEEKKEQILWKVEAAVFDALQTCKLEEVQKAFYAALKKSL